VLLGREPYTIFRTKKFATSPLSRFRSTDFCSRPLVSCMFQKSIKIRRFIRVLFSDLY
jgi:hypothetical protein